MGCMEWGGDGGGSGAYDYGSARRKSSHRSPPPRDYDDDSDRSTPKIYVPKSLTTDSDSPLVVACDITGSMDAWPGIIFNKLPLLFNQLKDNYFKDGNPEISFSAIDDADRFAVTPLQVQPFACGKALDERLGDIVVRGDGGGNEVESYDLAMLYYCRNVSMPKARKPIFIMIGDEGVYDHVNPNHAKYAHVKLDETLTAESLVKELKEKFSPYLIRKRYTSVSESKVKHQWYSLLGEDRVVELQAPERVVDVILGLVAHDVEMYEDFLEELTGRQTHDQTRTVLDALKSVTKHKALPGPGDGHSRTRKAGGGRPSKPLL